MRQTIELHVAGMREEGIELPQPTTVSVTAATTDAA